MTSSARFRPQYAVIGLVLITLLAATSPPVHAAVSSGASHHDSLLLTVNPDRSVDVTLNSTSNFPSQNSGNLIPTGLYIHSSSNFSQQPNAVVQNSVVEYQLPTPLNGFINSITLKAAQVGLSGNGSLTFSTRLPVKSANIAYSTSPSEVQINATAQLQLGCGLFCSLTPLSSQSTFQGNWSRTFGNATWIGHAEAQIENATYGILKVTTFSGTIDSITPTAASVSIRFVAVPSNQATDFITALEFVVSAAGVPSTGLDGFIRSALMLETGETTTLTYTSSTGEVIVRSTTTYVGNLDAKLNSLKNQYFETVFSPFNFAHIPIPSQLLFLNSTTISVSNISTISDLDLSEGTSSTTLTGLVLNPPTVGTNSNFTMPGLFQTLGTIPSKGFDLTLAGGSNSTYQVKVVVPQGTLPPSKTTTNTATWTNIQDAAALSSVQFKLQRVQGSPLSILTSPEGIAVEAIIAVAVVAGVLLFARRKNSKPTTPITSSGTSSSPDPGPSPPPPTL
ncbi:hypothetical protein J2P12_04240 [Candidatus Bathyarchaeota archaeon]|nr:hypothetical protein [Candidatus Bathyarchaeota archaeon]